MMIPKAVRIFDKVWFGFLDAIAKISPILPMIIPIRITYVSVVNPSQQMIGLMSRNINPITDWTEKRVEVGVG
jgi:hypothetical protein